MRRTEFRAGIAALAVGLGMAGSAGAAITMESYHPIKPTMSGTTVTITGKDLTLDNVVQVARFGAKVALGDVAKKRQADIYALMNQGAAEGVPIYLFNRNPGFLRETARFTGDPRSPENRKKLEEQALAQYQGGATAGQGGELADEDVIRAIMLIMTSQRTFRAASPESTQMLVDLLNNQITPVVRERGGTGQAQGPASSNIQAALVGAGEVYYKGTRMPAADALKKAGLKPIKPHPSDSALGATNSDTAGMAALMAYDARLLLDWIDLVYAFDLNGLNSSLTPLFSPVQGNRPYPWNSWVAARVLNMMKGSYLFEMDKTRIIQDPESMRAGYVREGAAWRAWAWLRDDLLIQINGSDGNPAAVANVSPDSSWELSTPWAMQYHVKGEAGKANTEGYIFSNANWDPYPLGNSIEAFTIALANLDIAVVMRQERFENPFYTYTKAHEVLGWENDAGGIPSIFNNNHEVWQRIQGLINPVPPEGYSSDPEYDQDLDAETLFKVERGVKAVDESWKLVATDLLSGARWIDVRKKQDATRRFGPAVEAAHAALRKIAPLAPRVRGESGLATAAKVVEFIRTTPAATFLANDPPMPPVVKQ